MLVLKTSSTRLQRNNFTSSKTSTSWRRLEDILQDVFKISWQMKHCYTEDVFKTSWRHVLKMSRRHYGDKQNIYWGYLDLTNLNVYLANLYFANLYLTILRRIQHELIRTIISIFILFWNSSSIPISRIKISDDCLVLWNQLNSNSTFQKRRGDNNEFLSNIPHKHI